MGGRGTFPFLKGLSEFLTSFGFFLLLPQILKISSVSGQELQNVNIVFFYEESETVKHFDAAVDYINKNPVAGVKLGKVHRIFSNGSDAKNLVTDICMQMDEIRAGPDKPDIAIDFTRHGVPSEAVKLVVKVINLPTVAATFGQEGDIRSWRDHAKTNWDGYLVQVSPPADLLVQSVRSIVGKQDMTSAVLLFDEQQYEMYHKYKSLLQNMPTRHLLTKLEKDSAGIRKQIDRLVHVDIVNFFIAATPNEISSVLAEASDKDMKDGPYFSDEYAWHSMSLEEGVPRCNACRSNVTVIHLSPDFTEVGEKRRSFLASRGTVKANRLTDMFYFDITINTILAVRKMKADGNWIPPPMDTKCVNTDNFTDTYKLDLYDALKTEGTDNILKNFNWGRNGNNYPIFTMKIERFVFKEHQAESETKEKLGVWRTGFTEHQLITPEPGKDALWKVHQALTVFRIVTVVQPPFVYKTPGCVESAENKYSRCFTGYCIDLLERIQQDLKFNYTIRNVSDYGYMGKEEPHEWTGMVKELKDRKADIALGAMSVMAERESVVDFTVPYYDLVGISILMRKPKTTTSLFKFLTVLENDVWMCILGAYFFTSILMWIFDRWSPYSYQNNREKYEDDEEKREFNLKECLWFCMTSLTPQGGGEAPKNLSGRLVAATWWLFGFIIIASYTANLAAFLTVSRLDAPVESLEDLSKQYKIQYAPQRDSAAWIYFDRMAHIEHKFYEIWKDMSLNDSMSDYDRSQLAVWDYPVSDKYTKMWQAMQENTPPLTFEEAVVRVRGKEEVNAQDGFAFLGDATDIRYEVLTSCDVQMVGEEFSRKPYALAVQQGSPLKDQLNDAILKLLNQRHLEQLKERWWNENQFAKKDCPKDDNQSDGISIHNIGGVFIVIFVGIVMACFTLIFEYWWYRKRNIAEEMAEMALPAPKEFGSTFGAASTDKTNFNTQYNKPPGARAELPSIENSW
ncbi:ionotropic receptor 25a isoform X1 [Folsomia candida]|uniref:ionotropic receptor 25a isoform X1 n=1 Tax=Folsomia candida TaxID=158441 RepID=UPI001604DD05|nr:ionotropic receptor 25a isoform X1 [Folsomia candida]